MGTGPRLQLLSEDNETNRVVEQAFAEWALAVDLAAKLRTMRMAKSTDGEAFAVLVNSPTLDHPVKLDLRPIEADRVMSPPKWFGSRDIVDGIEFDVFGNPTVYHVMKGHPGDTAFPFGIGCWWQLGSNRHGRPQSIRSNRYRDTAWIEQAAGDHRDGVLEATNLAADSRLRRSSSRFGSS